MRELLVATFEKRFGHRRCRVATAPGRVNLIGEHTDYNDGFVLPVAIDRYVGVAFALGDDPTLRGYSVEFDEERTALVSELGPRAGPPSWFDYAVGVAWALTLTGELSLAAGLDFVVSGDVPIGAGLSSSAALELAIARALFETTGTPWDPKRAAIAGQRTENDYIGLESGIMDQMAAALSREETAMLLDCRTLDYELIPMPDELRVVVLDTGTRRALAASAYNERRASCEKAVDVIRQRSPDVRALRDVSEAELEDYRGALDVVTFRRALHVVRENQRTVAMAEALGAADLDRVRELMAASHQSLRDLYEVSSPALDAVVDAATFHASCCGARMTGAGFGGCAVALVRTEDVSGFVHDVQLAYAGGSVFACRVVEGAHLL